MKKTLAGLAVLVLALGAAACETADHQDAAKESSGKTAAEERIKSAETDYLTAVLNAVDQVCSEKGAKYLGRTAQMVRDAANDRVDIYGSIIARDVEETGIVWAPQCDGKVNPDDVGIDINSLADGVDPQRWTQDDVAYIEENKDTLVVGGHMGGSYWLAPGNVVLVERKVGDIGFSSDPKTRASFEELGFTMLQKGVLTALANP